MPTVFLSYAHADNLAPKGGERRGWVSFFDDSLTIELGERNLVGVKLWRDTRDFDQMNVISESLLEAVRNSHIFLAVLSPRYPEQEYCRFELEQFFKAKAASGVQKANMLSLLVLKRPLQDDQIPAEIRGVGYLPFFEIDRETNDEAPFFDGFGERISGKYWEAIRKVGSLIERRLAELTGGEVKVQPSKDKAVIYLAEPGSDLSIKHWNVRKELESQGCRIGPTNPWPAEPDGAKNHLQAALEAADFSVHLLGATSGNAPASGLSSLASLQLDLAAGRAKNSAKFRRLIWIPADLHQADPAQRDLIESLENGSRLTAQDELVRSGLEEFKEVIRDELAQMSRAAGQRP